MPKLHWLVLVAAVLSSPAAFAAGEDEEDKPPAGEATEARKKFAEGNGRYARGDYEGAVEAFKAAVAADPKLPGPYRNLGLAYRALQRCAEALPNYEKYLELKPESRHTERVRREIDLCRAKLNLPALPPRPSTSGGGQTPHAVEAQSFLHVGANLIGGEATDEASVRIDGLVRGSTPLTVPVMSGVHKIHLEHPGFETADAVVEVAPGERKEVELTMNKLAVEPIKKVVYEPEAGAAPAPNRRKLAWGLLAGAAVAGLVGAGLGIAESDEHGKAVSADPATTTRAAIQQHADTGNALAIGAYVGIGVGAALLAASAVVFILDGKRGETHAPASYVVAPTASPNSAGVAAVVKF